MAPGTSIEVSFSRKEKKFNMYKKRTVSKVKQRISKGKNPQTSHVRNIAKDHK
jgi:hypothetical protein